VLVVVAVRQACEEGAERALAALGAPITGRRQVGPDRALLFATPPLADPVVADLRAHGWRAAARPEGGGHLSAWQRHTAPVDIDGLFRVCFPWSEFDRGDGPPAIEVDPGRSFGTGAHPSTRLLLVELARRARAGDRVLDVGCGSGVLALAAAHLGANVVATDIDGAALAATGANAAWNELSVRVSEGLPGGQFDVIVANIGAEELIALAPALVPRLASGGWAGLSGVSAGQVSRVAAAYGGGGEQRSDGEWAALVMTPAPHA